MSTLPMNTFQSRDLRKRREEQLEQMKKVEINVAVAEVRIRTDPTLFVDPTRSPSMLRRRHVSTPQQPSPLSPTMENATEKLWAMLLGRGPRTVSVDGGNDLVSGKSSMIGSPCNRYVACEDGLMPQVASH